MRVVLVRPPIVRELNQYGGVDEKERGNNGDQSRRMLKGQDTHTKILERFAHKGKFASETGSELTYGFWQPNRAKLIATNLQLQTLKLSQY